ncbi:MAG TPA: OmpA family protein [Candidatus Aquicultoraceae bacterium]|nr:OmpA family protein [Candidatus Aquicultoraceae bacterium]
MIDRIRNIRKIVKMTGAALAAVLLVSPGCATNPDGTTEYKRTAIGALGGAAVGAGAGALIAGRGHRGTGALIGGTVGALGGGAIGNYMDRQAAEMKRRLPEAAVAREGDKLYVALPSGILFDVDKAEIRSAARDSIAKAAQVLVQYPDTYITVEGHTDSTGSEEYNQKLSERRAYAVQELLVLNGVPMSRLSVRGYGETDPVADNSTAEGRQANRRVQLEIRPNEKLKSQQG